ncbi:MAG: 50S ribosomal protein L9 [Patescibacteria group bacterium]|jgi:large subunit ribosomal protein L9|nr:50S ribosomal protein L9 [Patescibacteria group bacterium]
MTKVLFLQNLEHHQIGEVKNVPDGYARNYLLPKDIAVLATDDEVKKLESKLAKMKVEEEKVVGKLEEIAAKIEAKTFKVEAQAGEEDKLFGAVTNKDLSEALTKEKLDVDKHEIEILEPIHTLGEHEALVKLGHGIHAKMKVMVERAK